MKKRLLALLLIALMVVSLVPAAALAMEAEEPAKPAEAAVAEPAAEEDPNPVPSAEGDETTPADDAHVTVTISNKGVLALARAAVTVKDDCSA